MSNVIDWKAKPVRRRYEDPDWWYACADELSTFADGMSDPISRGMMYRIASDYQQIAESYDHVARIRKRLKGIDSY